MKGGLKFFKGHAAAARNYLETDCSRADDYYLREGSGLAERIVVTIVDGEVRLEPASSMDAVTYESWVAGYSVETGLSKGQLGKGPDSLRFVEVVVNGPKSWSIAAALHPKVSDAYDAAQSAAAEQIIGWVAENATTRVGGRGRQVQVPVEQLEAAVVRHLTSREGDPHRHLHLQINARVFAEGKWRGLHSYGMLNSISALNGIGHAAVMTHPGFRQALAEHGYTLDPATGEIQELAEHVRHFSARSTQIGRNMDAYEAQWRTDNPGQEPSARLRRSWDRRAWADGRPDKAAAGDGGMEDLAQRWQRELAGIDHPKPAVAAPLLSTPIGVIDRHASAQLILTRLGAKRSAWNVADIRGEAERLIAELNVVAEPAARRELAEDLTARGIEQAKALIDPHRVPHDVRYLTSQRVLDVEAELTTRLGLRGNHPAKPSQLSQFADHPHFDTEQRLVAATLTGTAALMVIEGAAGAGKTTTLAAVNTRLTGQRMLIVTPTLIAAQVAQEQVGATARSAAALVHAHGFRWDDDGAWTRVPVTPIDEDAQLRPGDLLVIDEAAMLDQDTALALLTIADENDARVALIGDRHQLPAVGRGGVLDLAVACVNPDAHLTMDTVHRFTDHEYARLSLLMRTGHDAGQVFDALHARGQIRVHGSWTEAVEAVATAALAGALVTAETGDHVTLINSTAAERQLRTRCDRDGTSTLMAMKEGVITDNGERIVVGDPVVTRRNDPILGVANRQTWTVTAILDDRSVVVSGDRGERKLPPSYLRQHLERGYASTVYGAQGRTVDHAHHLLGLAGSASSTYVGMTRGRSSNTAHIVAGSLKDARTHWISTFSRDRADLGPTYAAWVAQRDLDRHGWTADRPTVTPPRPHHDRYAAPTPPASSPPGIGR